MNAIRKVGFTIITQGLLGLMTLFTGIVLPKYMGPEQYGYLQQFMFYLNYLNLLGLGFNDGLTLNYAGVSRESLPLKKIRSAIRIQFFYSILIMALIVLFAMQSSEINEKFVFVMLGINAVPMLMLCITNAICLAANNSIMYNVTNLLQRFLFCAGSFLCLINAEHTARNIIWMDTISFFCVLILLFFYCKDFFVGEKASWLDGIKETRKLCISGITITLSVTIMGLLPAFGRIVVENNESIRAYGIYSFYISVLSIILTFTNAVGVVAFPIMKNIDTMELPKYYKKLSYLYQGIGLIMYYAYIPLYILIKYYMPEYFDGIIYLAILLALCYPLGKIQVLIVPYYKAYRKEKELLFLNIVAICFMVVVVEIGYHLTKSIAVIASITTVVIIVYYMVLEKYLYMEIKKYCIKTNLLDVLTPVIFVLVSFQDTMLHFILLYSIYVALVVVIMFGKKIGEKRKC